MTTAINKTEYSWLIYPVGIDRKNMNLLSPDIDACLSDYEKRYNARPAAVALSAKNAHFAGQIPESIEVYTSIGGCLLSEIWLSVEKATRNKNTDAPETNSSGVEERPNPPERYNITPHARKVRKNNRSRCFKIPEIENKPVADVEKTGSPGRPRKIVDLFTTPEDQGVSRTTIYRRRKEAQGLLPL